MWELSVMQCSLVLWCSLEAFSQCELTVKCDFCLEQIFPTQRNSQGCFLFYRQWLFLFCWETLRHSRGNIQRCLSPAVSTKINAILTVVFLKHNLKHFRELRTLAESFFCFYPPLLTYFLRTLLKSQTRLQLVSLFLLQVTTSCQTNTSYEPVSMTCACMCFSNLCVCVCVSNKTIKETFKTPVDF